MAADYEFAVDWDADGAFTGTGEDVTDRVLERSSVTIRYGRDQARRLSPMAPGEMRIELNNVSRDYSPENSGSPLAGLVLPGREVRAQAVLNATTYGLFRGNLDDYDVLPNRRDRSVPLTCVDGLARLRGVDVSTGLHGGLRTGEAIELLLDAVGWPADARDLDTGATTIPWWWLTDTDAYTALQELVDSEGPGALCAADADGNIVFRDRHHRLIRSASTTVQATWVDSGTEPVFSDLSYDHGWRDIINSVTLPVAVRQLGSALSTVWSQDGQITLADGETVQLVAQASSPFSGAVTPVSGTDITVVSGTVTAGLSRTSGQVTTVSLTASGGPAIVSAVQLRAYALATVSTVQITAEDSTSISRYGRRSLPSGRQPVWAGVHDARAIADIILSQRAARLPTVTVTIVGGSDTQLAEQLGRDLSDRVHITDAETGLDADFFVEQIEHVIGAAGLFHTTRFGCEMVPTPASNPFTFDLSGSGFDDGAFGSQGLDDPDDVFIFDDPLQGQFDVGAFGN